MLKDPPIDSVHQAGALPSTPAPVGEPSVRAGFIKVYVTGFSELMEALDRAERKGYMPDAMLDEWSAFDYRPDKPPDMAPPALPQAAEQAEPVAWEWFDSKGEHRLTSTEPADYELAVRVTPFYAHPAPQVNQAVPGDADSVDPARRSDSTPAAEAGGSHPTKETKP